MSSYSRDSRPAMSRRPLRVLIAGVGGQGTLVAARVLGTAARNAGLGVRVGQLHGLAQRGGSVEGVVVIGPGRTAFIGPGEADIVLGLEPLETQRALSRMSEATRVLLNRQSVPLTHRGAEYPPLQSILFRIRGVTDRVCDIDATALACEAGGPRSVNVVMLGALAGLDLLPFDEAALEVAVDAQSPERFATINRRAYQLGRESVTLMNHK